MPVVLGILLVGVVVMRTLVVRVRDSIAVRIGAVGSRVAGVPVPISVRIFRMAVCVFGAAITKLRRV